MEINYKKALYLPETYLFIVYILVFLYFASNVEKSTMDTVYGLACPFVMFLIGHHLLSGQKSQAEANVTATEKMMFIFRILFFICCGVLLYAHIYTAAFFHDYLIDSLIYLFSFLFVPLSYGAILGYKSTK